MVFHGGSSGTQSLPPAACYLTPGFAPTQINKGETHLPTDNMLKAQQKHNYMMCFYASYYLS